MAEQGGIKINQFRGIDVSVPEDQVDLFRAADALNMIPDAIGQIRKRPGIHWVEGEVNGYARVAEEIEGRCRATFSVAETIFSVEGIGKLKGLFFTCDKKPLFISLGEKVMIFAWQKHQYNGEGPQPSAQGIINGEEYGAMVAMVEADRFTAFTDYGKKYIFKDDIWSVDAISADEPLLKTPINQIGCDYRGGGNPFEPINLLNPWATESFLVNDDTENVFVLNNAGPELEEDALYGLGLASYFKIEVLTEEQQAIGTDTAKKLVWKERAWTERDGYRVEKNWIYLPSGVGKTPKEGEDNLRITYLRRDFADQFNRLCNASCATFYGVGGFKDRLFLASAEWQRENRIYYSELSDPFYIGDLNFIELERGAKITALSGVADNLVAITEEGVYFAAGQVKEGEVYATDALFTVSGRIPAPKPITGGGVAILGGEIVYLSEEGVIAISSKDQYSERYAQHRSATINRKMLQSGPKFLVSLGRSLIIFCENGEAWLLDENQPNTKGNQPYSAHQYEGYRMDGFKAEFAYKNSEGTLILFRDSAKYRWTEGNEPNHYEDLVYEGTSGIAELKAKAILAFWETPWIGGGKFYLRKNFRRLGLMLDLIQGVGSGVRIEGKKNTDEWKILLDYDGRLSSFDGDYSAIDYRFFTYSALPGLPIIKKKIRVKKATRFKLRFINDIIGQSLTLNEWGLDYVQEG